MGDRNELITNIAIFLIMLSFLFRYILNKLRKTNLIIEEFSKESLEKDKFYAILLNIIAGFSVLLLILLVIELLSF